jgi:hypothetical protein
MPTFTWTGFRGIQSYVDQPPYTYQAPLTIDIQDAKAEATTPLIVWNENGQDNQMWECVKDPSSGYYFIQSKKTDIAGNNLVIDIKGGSKAAGKGAALEIFTKKSPPEDYDNQLWTFVDSGVSNPFGANYCYIQSKLKDPTTGQVLVIDIKGGYPGPAPAPTPAPRLDLWTQHTKKPDNQIWMTLS